MMYTGTIFKQNMKIAKELWTSLKKLRKILDASSDISCSFLSKNFFKYFSALKTVLFFFWNVWFPIKSSFKGSFKLQKVKLVKTFSPSALFYFCQQVPIYLTSIYCEFLSGSRPRILLLLLLLKIHYLFLFFHHCYLIPGVKLNRTYTSPFL